MYPILLQSMDCQAPLSMGIPRQEYWSGLPYSPPGDFPNPGLESTPPALAGGFFTTEAPGKSPGKNDVLLMSKTKILNCMCSMTAILQKLHTDVQIERSRTRRNSFDNNFFVLLLKFNDVRF